VEIEDKNKHVRLELVKVAQLLFQQHGFAKTTMDDIAKTAKKSKTTLYQCFKNKEEVLGGVLEKEMQEVYSTVITEINKAQTATDRLHIYMKTVLCKEKKRIFLYALMKGDLKAHLIACGDIKKDMDLLEVEEVKSILRNGILLNEFSQKHKDHVHTIACYLTNSIRAMMIQLVLDDNISSELYNEQNQDVLLEIFIRGLKN